MSLRTPLYDWHVKAGARVRVKLTMVNENRRYHVAQRLSRPAAPVAPWVRESRGC